MTEKQNPIRETDEEARELGRALLSDVRYAALGVISPDGFPVVSRVAVACSSSFGLYFSASDLSLHSKCLVLDPRSSLLVGDIGKGDGLAHPRMSLVGETARHDIRDDVHARLREHFLEIHQKAALYIDFADFAFYRMRVNRAHLNGGFGKAYELTPDDLDLVGN